VDATGLPLSEVVMNLRSHTFRRQLRSFVRLLFLELIFAEFTLIPLSVHAQTAGEGTISGTVTDSSGAAIPNAQITATNTATNVPTVRTSSSSGGYTIAPLPPGTYSLQVTANGFKTMRRDDLTVNALGVLNVDLVLTVGQETQTVVVTTAPPMLDTSTATLGLVMENETYANLPLQMNNAQRDPTAFGTLSPGAQSGSRLPVIGGTGNYLGQLYLDGMPAETISQQGDNRLVGQAMSVDAVDQFQVVTSTPPAEYSGAGAMNFTMKSGGLAYHGQVSDFVRNTIFDAWSFTAKAATTKNAEGQTIPAPKPSEHQNELSASVGGPVPHTAHKLFFFFAYDRYYERKGAVYSLYTVPTTAMRTGDFTELNGNVGGGGLQGTGPTNPAIIYDPTSNNCIGNVCTRQPFTGMKNGVPTNNVIPSGSISPIAQAMQSFLPAPTNDSVLLNNYLGGQPSGYNNFVIDYRVDFDLSAKQRLSTVGAMGSVKYLNNYAAPFLPPPYVGGDLASIYPKVFDIQHTYTINSQLINQFKFGYTRFFQNIQNATQGVPAWQPGKLGISNLPPGQASEEFPGATFATTPAYSGVAATSGGPASVQTTWTGFGNAISTQLTTPNNYTAVDNLQWLKGRHALTFGITLQLQQINNANPATYTGVLDLTYNANSTANFAANSSALSTGTATAPSGYSYASFLLGAVGGSPSIGLQPVSELGGRYRPISPYVEDSFKLTSKLTLDLGVRWDYLPPYHEVKNRWTFLNPNLTNGATGTPGELQFAGNYGGPGVSCGCQTPVHTYWKNWGPRIGLAYTVNSKMVIRTGFGQIFSQGGGVGGRGGAYQGTGQTGFNVTATGPAEITTGANAGPSFYLNGANSSLFGPGYVYPTPPAPSPASQILNTGNYLNGANKFVTASTVSYADPYISGRAPEFIFYNAGIERAITKDMTFAVNYVGNQSHFLVESTSSGGNARGYWANQLNPKYLAALGSVTDSTGSKPILISAATPANVAKAEAAMPGLTVPASFQSAASLNSSATIAQGLVAFPQYSGVTDTWGQNVGNFSYNSIQVTLLQRLSRGLTFNVNYTYSKNLGDDGTFRSGFPIPAGAISGNGQTWRQDRIDRSYTTISTPQSLHAFGVYQLPFGKGHFGSNSFVVRALAGGWQLSNIYTYSSGTPMAVIWTGCTSTNYPGQGQCMPDLNPAFGGYHDNNARIHGSYGTGPHGTTACNLGIGPGCVPIQYIDVNAFATPENVSKTSTPQYLIGNAPRTRALNLNNPGTQNLDTSLRRSFSLPRETSFVFEVDCLNTWNKATFAPPNQSWAAGSTTFGTVTGMASTYAPRDYQFAAHFKF
jgi:Carboxypeptidase regulatory-like domain